MREIERTPRRIGTDHLDSYLPHQRDRDTGGRVDAKRTALDFELTGEQIDRLNETPAIVLAPLR